MTDTSRPRTAWPHAVALEYTPTPQAPSVAIGFHWPEKHQFWPRGLMVQRNGQVVGLTFGRDDSEGVEPSFAANVVDRDGMILAPLRRLPLQCVFGAPE